MWGSEIPVVVVGVAVTVVRETAVEVEVVEGTVAPDDVVKSSVVVRGAVVEGSPAAAARGVVDGGWSGPWRGSLHPANPITRSIMRRGRAHGRGRERVL